MVGTGNNVAANSVFVTHTGCAECRWVDKKIHATGKVQQRVPELLA